MGALESRAHAGSSRSQIDRGPSSGAEFFRTLRQLCSGEKGRDSPDSFELRIAQRLPPAQRRRRPHRFPAHGRRHRITVASGQMAGEFFVYAAVERGGKAVEQSLVVSQEPKLRRYNKNTKGTAGLANDERPKTNSLFSPSQFSRRWVCGQRNLRWCRASA